LHRRVESAAEYKGLLGFVLQKGLAPPTQIIDLCDLVASCDQFDP
jgi:hypothetical protein